MSYNLFHIVTDTYQ